MKRVYHRRDRSLVVLRLAWKDPGASTAASTRCARQAVRAVRDTDDTCGRRGSPASSTTAPRLKVRVNHQEQIAPVIREHGIIGSTPHQVVATIPTMSKYQFDERDFATGPNRALRQWHRLSALFEENLSISPRWWTTTPTDSSARPSPDHMRTEAGRSCASPHSDPRSLARRCSTPTTASSTPRTPARAARISGSSGGRYGSGPARRRPRRIVRRDPGTWSCKTSAAARRTPAAQFFRWLVPLRRPPPTLLIRSQSPITWTTTTSYLSRSQHNLALCPETGWGLFAYSPASMDP